MLDLLATLRVAYESVDFQIPLDLVLHIVKTRVLLLPLGLQFPFLFVGLPVELAHRLGGALGRSQLAFYLCFLLSEDSNSDLPLLLDPLFLADPLGLCFSRSLLVLVCLFARLCGLRLDHC